MTQDKDFLITLGDRIRGLRSGKKLTQERLAEVAGLHTVSLSAIERGIANPSILTLEKISKALGLGLSEVLPVGKGKSSCEEELAEIFMEYRKLGLRERRLVFETIKTVIANIREK